MIKFAAHNRRKRWVQTLMWPGMQLQKLTTREPDLDQLAVAEGGEGLGVGIHPGAQHGDCESPDCHNDFASEWHGKHGV